MHNTFLENYAKTFTYPYCDYGDAPADFEQKILGKRKLRPQSLLSDDLTYNMQLYYQGYEPGSFVKRAKCKLELERERLQA